MYQILRRSPERPALLGHGAEVVPTNPLILHMQENRSCLSHEARSAVAVLALALMTAVILPAFEGLLFVPICALGALALLTLALEQNARAQSASETLEVSGHILRIAATMGLMSAPLKQRGLRASKPDRGDKLPPASVD